MSKTDVEKVPVTLACLCDTRLSVAALGYLLRAMGSMCAGTPAFADKPPKDVGKLQEELARYGYVVFTPDPDIIGFSDSPNIPTPPLGMPPTDKPRYN